jgi:aldehyde:ferredoxin oxidoreductase
VVEVKSPYTVDSAYGGPEYETLAGLGSNCGIDNLAAIAKGNELCNAYSLDTISTGAVVAFAMECFENGLLTTKDTDGLELRFGNAEAMLRVIELISQRKGIGDLLAEGTARAAQKIGRGAEKFAIHSKGLEAGMHEPRLKPGLGLGYMVNPHGADHCTNMHDSLYVAAEQIKELMPLGITEPVPAEDIGPRKVALFRTVQFRQIINDSLVLCSMLPYSFRQIADVTAAVTGWNTGVMEHFRIAERILTMARLFNLREGFEADDDRLPARFFEPKTDGALSNKPLEQAKMEKARSYYYTLMGWNPRTGVPLPEKLEELGIS